MKNISKIYSRTPKKIKILQYGEGNFLRGFADYIIDIANERGVFNGDIAVVKPIPSGSLEQFHKQNNLYTVSLRGKMNGETHVENRVVTCIQKVLDPYCEYAKYSRLAKLDSLKFIISNTTEAGIVFDEKDKFELMPPGTFPGKLAKFLYERYIFFNGSVQSGLVMLPVELIEDNGVKLRECVLSYIDLWGLGDGFKRWVCECNIFCSTLVDRIITGFPKNEAPNIFKELGYEDNLLNMGEPFALWVIESDTDISEMLPLDKAGLPVIFTNNLKPYRERKVRILNGAHTSTVLAAYLSGMDTVLECMDDPVIRGYMEKTIFDEIVPTVKLPVKEAEDFANAVLERFENPFVRHSLLSISLNSVSKWKARILPSFKDFYEKTHTPAKHLTFSFAALMAFYASGRLRDGMLIGRRGEEEYVIKDGAEVLSFFAKNNAKMPTRDFVSAFASRADFWGEDLTELNGFTKLVCRYLESIKEHGVYEAVRSLAKE